MYIFFFSSFGLYESFCILLLKGLMFKLMLIIEMSSCVGESVSQMLNQY